MVRMAWCPHMARSGASDRDKIDHGGLHTTELTRTGRHNDEARPVHFTQKLTTADRLRVYWVGRINSA